MIVSKIFMLEHGMILYKSENFCWGGTLINLNIMQGTPNFVFILQFYQAKLSACTAASQV